MSEQATVKALVFDVFGTVVDWRNSVARDLEAFGRAKGISADWTQFTDDWRGAYQPSMDKVRKGERSWTVLDDLHRETLDMLLEKYRIAGLGEADRDHLTRTWHRLSPWPDAVAGLTRLKEKYIIGTCSNGNVSLMLNLAKHSGLPWDMIFGAELVQRYKPDPLTYQAVPKLLRVTPGEVMMVAAHNYDLLAAGREGLKTAFVARPTEYGPHQKRDFKAEHDFTVVARDFVDLAAQLGA